MNILRCFTLVAGCALAIAPASAQISLTPPAAQAPPKAPPKAPAKATPPAKAPPAAAKKAAPAPGKPAEPAATAPADANLDLVYGAYQRGQYKTAFDLATQRAQENNDPKAMTMLGELYANAMGVKRDYAKAALKRAAELLRVAADAGNPEAQYALATFYKEGTGVEKNLDKAVRLLQAAALADNVDATVEYAIALYNGTGTPKNEAGAVALLRKASKQNSPIAQNRLARVLINRPDAADRIEGLKWHIVAKTAGKGDLFLDEALANATPEDRTTAQNAARKWLGSPTSAK